MPRKSPMRISAWRSNRLVLNHSDHFKVLLAVTGIISIAGGLTAIMYIDALQAVIMIIGAFTLCLQCFSAANISSLSQFKQAYLNSTYDYHELTG